MKTIKRWHWGVVGCVGLLSLFVLWLGQRDPIQPLPASGPGNPPTVFFSKDTGPEPGPGGVPSPNLPAHVQVHARAAELPAWAVPYQREFWQGPPAGDRPNAASGLAKPGSLDVTRVIERVSHAFVPEGGRVEVAAEAYTAFVDGGGLHLSPHQVTHERKVEVDPGTEAVVRTRLVRREHDLFRNDADGFRAWSVIGNTAQAELAAGVVEHFEAVERGISMTWVLQQPLPGRGELTVEADVIGLAYAGETSGGHHFADQQGRSRLRIGSATAIDARGDRWELPVTPVPGGIRVELAANILDNAHYPLAIDPLIGPEFGLDTPVLGPATWPQYLPHVAASSNNFLVIWQWERRLGIYATRVDVNGQLLDPTGFLLTTNFYSFYLDENGLMDVSGQGTNFLLVWIGQDLNVYARTIADSGEVSLGPVIQVGAGTSGRPAIAARNGQYLVSWPWRPEAGSVVVFGARITSGGVLLDSNSIPICTVPGNRRSLSAAANDDLYLVTWIDDRSSEPGLYGARVNDNGTVLDPNGFGVSISRPGQSRPNMAGAGSQFLLVWEDTRNYEVAQGTNYLRNDIYGTRISSQGVVSNPGGVPIISELFSQAMPTVGLAGSNGFWVVCHDWASEWYPIASRIIGTRVAADGTVVDSPPVVLCAAPAESTYPFITGLELAKLSGTNLLIWSSWYEIYGVRVTDDASVLDPTRRLLSMGPNQQRSPGVGWNGEAYLVTWQDSRGPGGWFAEDIYGVRIANSGDILDPVAIPICTNRYHQYSPVVAACAGNFLVVWADGRNLSQDPSNPYPYNPDIFGTMVSGAGVVANLDGIPITTAASSQRGAAVAASSNQFLVVWVDDRPSGFAYRDIYGARVSATGTLLDPDGIPICQSFREQAAPAVASDGNDFLVVWRDDRFYEDNADIYGMLVPPSGVVYATNEIPICTAPNQQRGPEIAANEHGYLVVWRDLRNVTSSGSDIFGARITRAGRLIETHGFPICTLTNWQWEPAVGASGENYLVAWQDDQEPSLPSWNTRIHGTRVSPNGQILDGPGMLFNPAVTDDDVLAIIGGAAGQFLVLSEGIRGGEPRVVAQFVLDHAPLAIHGRNGQAQLTWIAQPGLVLQHAADLRLANWETIAVVPVAFGATQVVTRPITGGSAFFRLHRP